MADQRSEREAERLEAEKRSAPAARVVHAAVLEQGEDELDRPAASLFWSAFSAGVAIMASLWVSGALYQHLPATSWREVLTTLGYPVGFLIIILGRLSLFTEHTAVAVLPVATKPSLPEVGRLARLWALVFIANMLGAAAAAAVVVHAQVQSAEMLAGMVAVSKRLLDRTWFETLLQAIPAGFLIASIAWIRSATKGSDFWIVFTVTYAIALCGFAHVVAGASEAFVLLWNGDVGVGWALGSFVLPALVGNVLGGTGLFAALAHAQVKEER